MIRGSGNSVYGGAGGKMSYRVQLSIGVNVSAVLSGQSHTVIHNQNSERRLENIVGLYTRPGNGLRPSFTRSRFMFIAALMRAKLLARPMKRTRVSSRFIYLKPSRRPSSSSVSFCLIKTSATDGRRSGGEYARVLAMDLLAARDFSHWASFDCSCSTC